MKIMSKEQIENMDDEKVDTGRRESKKKATMKRSKLQDDKSDEEISEESDNETTDEDLPPISQARKRNACGGKKIISSTMMNKVSELKYV